uniref:RING-type domain-containing protein n=1 Tax=Clytia hemisphaerica TaxID=252671 RepID=A0A7M5V5E9_9CNID
MDAINTRLSEIENRLVPNARNFRSVYQPNQGGPPAKRSFTPKKTWTATFFCLSEKGATHTPSSSQYFLYGNAGLGKKRIQMPNTASHLDLQLNLEEEFPKLCICSGRFMLYKATGGGSGKRQLQRIELGPCGYSVPYLRDNCNVSHSTIYIVPIQHTLDMTAVVKPSYNSPTVDCQFCGDIIELALLEEHTKSCNKKPLSPRKEDDSSHSTTTRNASVASSHSTSTTSSRLQTSFHTTTRNALRQSSRSTAAETRTTNTTTNSLMNTQARPISPVISQSSRLTAAETRTTNTATNSLMSTQARPISPVETGTIDATSNLAAAVSRYNMMKPAIKEWAICDICREVIDNSPSHLISCKCRFHSECLNEWMERSLNCPTCGTKSCTKYADSEMYDEIIELWYYKFFRHCQHRY